MKTYSVLLKIAAMLWIIWGVVHTFAGIMTINFVMSDNIAQAVMGIADAVDPTMLDVAYPDAVGGIIGQHGFNLLWFGLVTIVGGVFIWRKSTAAIFMTAMVGGFADLGYFIFVDLAGYARFFPGTVMTMVSASAIILSFVAYFGSNRMKDFQSTTAEKASTT